MFKRFKEGPSQGARNPTNITHDNVTFVQAASSTKLWLFASKALEFSSLGLSDFLHALEQASTDQTCIRRRQKPTVLSPFLVTCFSTQHLKAPVLERRLCYSQHKTLCTCGASGVGCFGGCFWGTCCHLSAVEDRHGSWKRSSLCASGKFFCSSRRVKPLGRGSKEKVVSPLQDGSRCVSVTSAHRITPENMSYK